MQHLMQTKQPSRFTAKAGILVLAVLVGGAFEAMPPAGAETTASADSGDGLDSAALPLAPSDAGDVSVEPRDSMDGNELWVNSFSLLADELRVEFPADFAAAEINADQNSGWVAFESAAPEGAVEQIASLDGVEIREGLGANETEIGDAASRVFEKLYQSLGNEASVATYPVPAERKIVVEVGSSQLEAAQATDALGSIDNIASSADVPEGFEVTVVDVGVDPAPVAELFDGGRSVAGVCTGAFPVKRRGGIELGILTAAHCPGTGSYDGVANAFSPPAAYSIFTGPGSDGGDFRWNHSKVGLSGATYVGTGLRTFTSHATPNVGGSICGYGKTTGYKCQTLEVCGLTSTATVPDTGLTYPVGGLCRTVDQVTQGGDSGGPWFLGNTAYGIHHGSNYLGSYLSLVNNALNQTRVNMVVDAAGRTIP